MSWVNAVKGAIFEDASTNNTMPPPVAAQPATGTPTVSVGVDVEMVNAIKKTTLARKTAYTALLEAADKMISVIPDGNTRLKAAYAMVAGEQRTIDTIVNALDVHISDVDGERLRFTQQTGQLMASEVETLKAQAASLDATTNQLRDQITSLTQQVADNVAKSAALVTQATTRSVELEQAANKFAAAAQSVRSEFEQQRVSLSTILSQ
jgi:chromosome segregation ATPase